MNIKNHTQRCLVLFLLSIFLIFCETAAYSQSCGDVNNSGAVDIIDALMTAQHYVGMSPVSFNASVADVNNDGKIDIVDALIKAQYYVEIITSLSCPEQNPTVPPSTPTPALSDKIIADHTVIDYFNNIPSKYINEVKKILVNIPGESHAKGYIYGLEQLAIDNPVYAVSSKWSSAPEADTSDHLRVHRTLWVADETPGWNDNIGEAHIWTSTTARSRMNTHFAYAKNTLNNNFDVFLWGWCWDMGGTTPYGGTIDPVYQVRWGGRHLITGLSADQGIWGLDEEDNTLTGAAVNMDDYLEAIALYNTNNSDTIVIYTTGPGDATREQGYSVFLKNEHIRKYVTNTPNAVLFDYADILSYDNYGNPNTTSWTDYGGVDQSYELQVSAYDQEYDGGKGSCHISREACIKLGKALWWMLARISGWDGVSAE